MAEDAGDNDRLAPDSKLLRVVNLMSICCSPKKTVLSYSDPKPDGFADQLQRRAEPKSPDHSLQFRKRNSVRSTHCNGD
jgi:hypothetical protein